MRSRIGRLALIAASTVAFALAGQPSASAACLELDMACRADGAIDAGKQLLDDSTEPVETPVDETTDPIVEDGFDRAHEVLAGNPIDLPDPIGGGGGAGGGGGGQGGMDPRPPGAPNQAGSGGVGGRNPDGPGLIRPVQTIISAASGASPRGGHVDRTFGEGVGEALGGLARSLAIVLALFGLAVAFVTIQDRLDRNDPRLALAPVDSDVVEFA